MKSESTSNIPPLAFPVCVPDQRGPEGEPICEGFSSLGMELRDYFAASALNGWRANPNGRYTTYEAAATEAYKYADAMMAARLTAEKKEEGK